MYFIAVDNLNTIDSLNLIIQNQKSNSLYNFWETLAVGILGSMIASFIFIFLILWFFRPRIKISPFICKDYLPGESDVKYYFIKIVNKSWFSAYQVSASLNKRRSYPTPPTGMTNNRITPLTLVLDELNHLHPFRPDFYRKEAKHAFRFRTIDDLSAIIDNPNNSILFEIKATHGLTGITKVFVEEYSHSSQVKNGQFTYGTKFNVLT